MTHGSKTLVNLYKGWPNTSLLPTAQIQSASATAFSNPAVLHAGLSYGPDIGYEPLRRQLAGWLTRFYQPADPIGLERICISGGASQNLACVLQVFSDPAYTRVWMVSPVYYLACRIFEDNGFHGRMRAVREDEEGIDMEFLQRGLRESDEKEDKVGNKRPKFKFPRPSGKIYRHLIYAVPTSSNPSSQTMSLRRRQQLIMVAREHDALVITDDVYDQLQWPVNKAADLPSLRKAVAPRLVDVDRYLEGGATRKGADGFGNAMSNGSFSKIVGPGCRTGWAEGTDKFAFGLSETGSNKSGGAPSQLTATIMASLLESGDVEHHIYSVLQPSYARRHHRLISAIDRHLVPQGVTLPQSNREVMGGYFVWLSLPAALQAGELVRRAKDEENLMVAEGPLFGVSGDSEGQGLDGKIRLSFSWEEEALLEEGIVRLAKVIQRMKAAL